MPKLMIFNREEEYIGDVKDIIQASQKLEINGEDSLTIETLDNRLEKGYRILYHDRDADKFYEYIIQEKEEYKSGKTIIINIYADNSISELMGDYIEDKRSINQFASHAIERALEGTRWSMGRFYNGWRGTTTFYRTNARAAISDIMDEWQLEMETEIEFNKDSGEIKRTLHLVYRRGQVRSNRLTYTRDIVDIKRKTLPRDIITALYGYGKGEQTASGGYTRRIDFSDVNNGKSYVENNEAKELWGRVGSDGKKIHTFAKIEFESIEDKQLLLERTQSELEKLSKPAVSYEVSILDFFRLSKSEHDYIELGDTVRVLDRDFTPSINYSTRVVEITRDLVNVENTRIVLGEVVKSIADRESEQDKRLEEISEEGYYDEWEDDEWGDGDWGDDTTYYNPDQLTRAVPSLSIGRVSWVDVSSPDSVDFNINGKVLNVRDYFTKEVVYTQDEVDKRPTLRNMDGRRWLSFNPDPMVLQRWMSGRDIPWDNLIKQNGQYLENLLSESKATTVYIAYHDRTPKGLGGYRAENNFPNGFSSPIGYPHSGSSWYRSNGLMPSRSGQENVFYGTEGKASRHNGGIPRVRDENVIARLISTGVYEKYQNFLSLGMNKKSYDSIRASGDDRPTGYGYTYNMNAFFTGEIAEVIVYSREVDAREHREITDYLKDKYSASRVLSNR